MVMARTFFKLLLPIGNVHANVLTHVSPCLAEATVVQLRLLVETQTALRKGGLVENLKSLVLRLVCNHHGSPRSHDTGLRGRH